MTDSSQNQTAKLVTLGVTLAAGWLAQKIVGEIWKRATGNDAHESLMSNPDDDAAVSAVQAATFAAVSAAVGVFSQRWAKRGAAKYFASK